MSYDADAQVEVLVPLLTEQLWTISESLSFPIWTTDSNSTPTGLVKKGRKETNKSPAHKTHSTCKLPSSTLTVLTLTGFVDTWNRDVSIHLLQSEVALAETLTGNFDFWWRAGLFFLLRTGCNLNSSEKRPTLILRMVPYPCINRNQWFKVCKWHLQLLRFNFAIWSRFNFTSAKAHFLPTFILKLFLWSLKAQTVVWDPENYRVFPDKSICLVAQWTYHWKVLSTQAKNPATYIFISKTDLDRLSAL